MFAASKMTGKGKAVARASPSSRGISEDRSSASGSSTSGSEEDPSASDDDTDSDFEEVSPEYLESLISKAKANMARRRPEVPSSNIGDDVIDLGNGNDESEQLPSLDPGTLPPAYFSLGASKIDLPSIARDVDTERAEQASNTLTAPAPPAPPPELKKDGKALTKKEKKALKNTTAGPGWFDLPAPDAADLPRLYREVEALRLRNALDPKRFYKKEEGEGKGIKGLPQHFAIGTIIPSTTPFGTASAENLARSQRKRTIVDELVDDAEAKRYAKKKFLDLQGVRSAKGRGTLAKKRALRQRKW